MNVWPFASLTLTLALILASQTNVVHARETRTDRSITAAIRAQQWQVQALQGITLRFGSSTHKAYATASVPTLVSNFARTVILVNGRSQQRDDGSTCDEALRNALAEAAERARKTGANAIVNITSKFLDTAFDSKTQYTCNSGIASATVDLIVQFASLTPEQIVATNSDTPYPINLLDAPLFRMFPPATNFAALSDVNAIPFLSSNCKAIYTERWLRAPLPRAFAVGPTGVCGFSWGFTPPRSGASNDPAIRAKEACNAQANRPCVLYAIDNDVVWRDTGHSDTELTPVPVDAKR
jgi:uncharacterized protein YbjQ (UPF0145 family)